MCMPPVIIILYFEGIEFKCEIKELIKSEAFAIDGDRYIAKILRL